MIGASQCKGDVGLEAQTERKGLDLDAGGAIRIAEQRIARRERDRVHHA